MLIELKIKNLALISSLDIGFGDGLTVMTGETGAGKSIILQAVNLLYGEKAAGGWVRNGAESAVVEALFSCAEGSPVVDLLVGNGFEGSEEVILKRVVSSKGSSRYYINSSLATAKVVGEIAENLVSIASQHDHQRLLSPAYQLDFIDLIGGLMPLRNTMAEKYGEWLELKKELASLLALEKDKEQRRDFLSFQYREITDAGIRPGEDEELEVLKNRLRAFEVLRTLGGRSHELLDGQVNDSLAEVRNDLAQMASHDPGIQQLAEEFADHSFQIEELSHGLRNYLDNMSDDPDELDGVTARIDLLQKLKRKYGPTLEEVVAFGARAETELQGITDLDERIGELGAQLQKAEMGMLSCCRELSRARRSESVKLAESVTVVMKELCLENADFRVEFTAPEEQEVSGITACGWDRPQFVFTANPGEPLKPVAKVASGGELSRLMLALKSILASHDQVETVIFDEVDAGISGKTAEAVARKIRALSAHHQVLCITHLPQIASGAGAHFTVRKTVAEGRTHTTITVLDDTQRVAELARMLDGDSVTEQTLSYARELVGRNKAELSSLPARTKLMPEG
ncbi:MAG: DNA repair protein RecN [Proteobacteria bacterium]|nr:DNA repair protein RecN [Pseudomonadota bacterium]MBU1738706.1 DNA repair protein RecN [Pseudomonadota bacterium]